MPYECSTFAPAENAVETQRPSDSMVNMEACEICGYAWESVGDDDIPTRIVEGAAFISDALRSTGARAIVRPAADRWSTLEYAAHVRDVLLHVRDRLVIGISEDNPEFKPLYREERVNFGLYAADTPQVVAAELDMAAALFARTFVAIRPEQLDRPCQYAYPAAATRSLRWMGQQVVHEVFHHGDDIRENLAASA